MSDLKQLFDDTGVLVFKNALPTDVVAGWRMQYDALSNPERVPEYNKVAVNDERLQPLLSLIAANPVILDAVEQVFGHDIALYNQRFIVKDKHARDVVFLHQDTPYHVGWPTKLSAFVALSRVMPENGGLIFYPGTHKYGYLGDAGEIRREHWAGASDCPELTQGDFVLMHSATWHESARNTNGIDRILADIIYQPANDPSGNQLLRGEWLVDQMPESVRANLFVSSRTMRMREMQERITALEEYNKWAECPTEKKYPSCTVCGSGVFCTRSDCGGVFSKTGNRRKNQR